jgi:hypothetical protein
MTTPNSPAELPFHVFLCHNSEDKPEIRKIYNQLTEQSLRPWIDEQHLIPGRFWLDELGKQVNQIGSAAVFVGSSGIGPWQEQEIASFLAAFIRRKVPVIPVFLATAPKDKQPILPVFLENFTWVDFRQDFPDPMNSLIWGITGRKPTPVNSLPPTRPGIPDPPDEQDDLSSERELDYTKLCNLLKAQDWKAADRETYQMMIRAVGRQPGDHFHVRDLENFPLVDLKNIDRLWRKYSNEHFGFWIQKQIYLDCGAASDSLYPGDTVWEEFGDRVGWRNNGQWLSHQEFNPSLQPSFKGSLPREFCCGGALGNSMQPTFGFGALLRRLPMP